MTFSNQGWRPDDLGKGCQKFPNDAPQPKGKDFHAMDCQVRDQ